MVALDALAAPEAEVHRPPSRQQRRERPHVLGRRATAAEARGEARKSRLVDQALDTDFLHPAGDHLERLVPRDLHEPGVFASPFFRVGALHRAFDTVRVVGLLNHSVGLDADLPAAGMRVGDVVIRFDPCRDPIFYFDPHQVRPSDTLIAIDRDGLSILQSARHVPSPQFDRFRVSHRAGYTVVTPAGLGAVQTNE